jgi:glycine betaine/proline transport system permease protein/glycine betaine/proline transport system substrate-binding protein
MGVQRIEIGRGLLAGTAVVIVAIVMDRITQGFSYINSTTTSNNKVEVE